MYQRAVIRAFQQLQVGHLTLIDGDAQWEFGAADSEWCATLHVTHPEFYRRLVWSGDLGFAEAILDGHCHADDLVALVRIFIRNLELVDSGNRRLGASLRKLSEWSRRMVSRRNTRRQAQRNIHEHYDLGNAFFQSFLDPSMNYSSAIFQRPADSMLQGSINKMWRICRKLQLQASDHLLEIGTGWGGLALFAARHFGCRVTTTTISEEQYLLARDRVRRAGLEHQVEVLKNDYRDLQGQYDKLVSIEMIEAVGHQYFDTFFQTCSQLLRPEGLMLLQSIVIREARYRHHLKNVDFIQKYIFPGGCLPSHSALLQSMSRSTDWMMLHAEDIGFHYAGTLRRWRAAFESNRQEILKLKPSAPFMRMWHYYLCYCEAAFLERQVSNTQWVLAGNRCSLDVQPVDWELSRDRLVEMADAYAPAPSREATTA